jgi:hypothetical protein
MVAADLRRIESNVEAPLVSEGPSVLRAEEFLVGNPGIQGSNLFLRLSVLLAAGGFDEALRSSTDRDLCIRIADMGTVRYGRLPIVLVDHYAIPDQMRLSTRGSAAKLEGLTAFWRKYAGRMTVGQQQAFSERASELFEWNRPSDLALSVNEPIGIESEAPVHQPFSLYVGIITSDSRMLGPLLNDLAALQTSGSLNRVVVLILDNGSSAGDLDDVIHHARQAGLEVAVVDEAQQCQDARIGAFGTGFRTRGYGQVGIAQARTMLQRYLGELLEQDLGSFGWVLDDDMRVDDRARAYLPWLPSFRDEGVDALLGAYEGSSPNPPLNGLRVHLVDLFHNLTWLQKLPAQALLPDRSAENAVMREKFPDYYYDLSRKHTGHLEMPHWLEPEFRGETVAEAYSRLLIGATAILSGGPLTRPIISNMPSNPLASAKDSVNRGGCTFILNHRTLTLASNTILRIHGREARRSDMIWAIVNRDYRRMKIKAVSFPVHHVGRITETPSLNVDKVQGEILGSALYAGLSDFLNRNVGHELDFSKEETEEVRRLAEENLGRRVRLLEQSFYRISGLHEAIQRIARHGELDELLGYLKSWFSKENFDQICSGVCAYSSSEVERFLASLRDVSDDFATTTVNIDLWRCY